MAGCPHITALSLSDTAVGDRGLAAIAAALGSQLRSLQLNSTRGWGAQGGAALAARCPQLQCFSAAASGAEDDALAALGAGCPQLNFVCVDRCRDVTLDGVMRLVNRRPSLQYVELAGVQRQSPSEQQAAFGRWVQRRGLRFDPRSGLLACGMSKR